MTKTISLLMLFLSFSLQANLVDKIELKKWIHGSKSCASDNKPAIDILQVNSGTYILRQNKCLHYEAPFIYVMFGQHSVFIQDTGATSEAEQFPLYTTISQLVEDWKRIHNIQNIKLIVSHSHSHSDHYAADKQFAGRANVELIEPNSQAVRTYFNFTNWPEGMANIELGGRTLNVLPLPGHQEDALAIYDGQTQFMLTGDSFYPGRLYIKDWAQYIQSVERLLSFSKQHVVSAFLGTHIEMTQKVSVDFPIGTTYQPNERHLVLTQKDLGDLHAELASLGNTPTKKALEHVIINPVGNN